MRFWSLTAIQVRGAKNREGKTSPMEVIRKYTNILQEFSVPLMAGVVLALIFANTSHEVYEHFIHFKPFGEIVVFGHELTVHFLINDVFMVFFFGIAAKEIAESVLPGGDLNPPSKAVNPLMATLGGVAGPVAVFFIGLHLCYMFGIYPQSAQGTGLERGWGIPTATDIALAWLVARTVFGKGHPAINFLLLLAIADDAIGLVIIAVFYPSQEITMAALAIGMGTVLVGMAVAYGMRRAQVNRWQLYIFLAGPIVWAGLGMAHLHQALALVFIVPFLPAPSSDRGLFVEPAEGTPEAEHDAHSPLHAFEHQIKTFVDFGLFFFAFANAGVMFAGIGPMTWLVFGALVIGKVVGVCSLGLLARKLGFPLPDGMNVADLMMAGLIAAVGLTVALFVATSAFSTNEALMGEAKMGALFSGLVGVLAVVLGRMLGLNKSSKPG